MGARDTSRATEVGEEITAAGGSASYVASEGAVVQLTRTLGAEWIQRGVHVNAIGRVTSTRR